MELKDYIYYQDSRGVLYKGDSLEILPLLAEDSIDFVFSDFPYNISNNKNSLTKRGATAVIGDFGCWDKWDTMEGYLTWVENIAIGLKRVSKDKISLILFFDNRMAGYIAYTLELKSIVVYKAPIIWEKNNPIPHFRKSGFRSAFEHGVWLINTVKSKTPDDVVKPNTFNFLSQKEMTNVMRYNIGQNITTHPTEKPIELVSRMVEVFTNKDDVVLDAFAGSGTTGVACKKLGRHYIMIEKEEKYCEMIKTRLQTTHEQVSLPTNLFYGGEI